MHVVTTETFRSFNTQRKYCIKPDDLDCRSCNVMYLFSCKVSSKQYTGSTEGFQSRFNSYKSVYKNFTKKRLPSNKCR